MFRYTIVWHAIVLDTNVHGLKCLGTQLFGTQFSGRKCSLRHLPCTVISIQLYFEHFSQGWGKIKAAVMLLYRRILKIPRTEQVTNNVVSEKMAAVKTLILKITKKKNVEMPWLNEEGGGP